MERRQVPLRTIEELRLHARAGARQPFEGRRLETLLDHRLVAIVMAAHLARADAAAWLRGPHDFQHGGSGANDVTWTREIVLDRTFVQKRAVGRTEIPHAK